MGAEARVLGHGGVEAVARAAGASRMTVTGGVPAGWHWHWPWRWARSGGAEPWCAGCIARCARSQRPRHTGGLGDARGQDFDDRCVIEMLRKPLRVNGCRGDDDLEVGAAPRQLFEVTPEVDVEAALVRLVDDDRVVAAELAVTLHLGQQDAIGHHLDQGVATGVVGEAHLDNPPQSPARCPAPARCARPPT